MFPGIPGRSPMRFGAGAVWVAGPPGGGVGSLVQFDTATGSIVSETHVQSSVVALAVGFGSAWVATQADQTVNRYRVP